MGAPLSRLVRFAAFAALGLITGPLAAGLVRSLRNGQPVLAGLYLVAIPATYGALALAGAWAAGVLRA